MLPLEDIAGRSPRSRRWQWGILSRRLRFAGLCVGAQRTSTGDRCSLSSLAWGVGTQRLVRIRQRGELRWPGWTSGRGAQGREAAGLSALPLQRSRAVRLGAKAAGVPGCYAGRWLRPVVGPSPVLPRARHQLRSRVEGEALFPSPVGGDLALKRRWMDNLG